MCFRPLSVRLRDLSTVVLTPCTLLACSSRCLPIVTAAPLLPLGGAEQAGRAGSRLPLPVRAAGGAFSLGVVSGVSGELLGLVWAGPRQLPE